MFGLSSSAGLRIKAVYTKLYAITNPPMFTAKNSIVSHAKSTTAFNTVMAHFCGFSRMDIKRRARKSQFDLPSSYNSPFFH